MTQLKRSPIVLALVLMSALACASTPKQRYLTVLGTYDAVLTVALDWAESPEGQADPEALAKIVAVKNRVRDARKALSGSPSPSKYDVAAIVIQAGLRELQQVLAENEVHE